MSPKINVVGMFIIQILFWGVLACFKIIVGYEARTYFVLRFLDFFCASGGGLLYVRKIRRNERYCYNVKLHSRDLTHSVRLEAVHDRDCSY